MTSIFSRLVGLETEYAIRYVPPSGEQAPTKFRLYQALVESLRRRMPVAAAKHFKEGVFGANGGAVWFESEMPSAGGGLIEGATPECRGPREAVLFQRAQDRLLAECARDAGLEGDFRLVKNSRDSRENVYGSQENYEADIADGSGLFLWRLGLTLLFPVALLTWVGILVSIIGTLTYFMIAAAIYVPARYVVRDPRSLALKLFGPDLLESRETCLHIPVWLESLLQKLTRVITLPLAAGLYVLIRLTAFTTIRRHMLPFLVSRSVISGAGMVDANGVFHIADKGMAINCVVGFGGLVGDRPIFNMGHLFKTAYAESWFAPKNYLDLFAQRQRLQIGLGDSNMAEVSEFLRVGTTLLVLDAIEAGAIQGVPKLRRPINALHTICNDPTLSSSVRTERAEWTAIELQRFYWDACERFVEDSLDPPAEAFTVLRLWKEMLDGLESLQREGSVPMSIVGSIDWATKRVLLEEVNDAATWSEKKKIDIRYHELSVEGYFQKLRAAGIGTRVIDSSQVERAMRTPPANTPATTRGQFIREFTGGDEPVSANWKRIIIGKGRAARVIPLGATKRGNGPKGRPKMRLEA